MITLVENDPGVPSRTGKKRPYDPAQTRMSEFGNAHDDQHPQRPYGLLALAATAGLVAAKPKVTMLGRVLPASIAVFAVIEFLSSKGPLRGPLAGVDCGCGCNGAPGGCGS